MTFIVLFDTSLYHKIDFIIPISLQPNVRDLTNNKFCWIKSSCLSLNSFEIGFKRQRKA